MKYDNEFVKRVTNSVIQGICSIREASRILDVARNTISTWVRRTLTGLSARFKRSAKRVWNRTPEEILAKLKAFLASGKTVVQAWQAIGKKRAIRTIER